MNDAIHTPNADEALLHSFLNDDDGPKGKAVREDASTLKPRVLPPVHRVDPTFGGSSADDGAGAGIKARNQRILDRFAEITAFFESAKISPVESKQFKSMIIDKLVELNVAYIVAEPNAEPVGGGVSAHDMVKRGITASLATSPVAQAAVAAGVDLLGGDDDE